MGWHPAGEGTDCAAVTLSSEGCLSFPGVPRHPFLMSFHLNPMGPTIICNTTKKSMENELLGLQLGQEGQSDDRNIPKKVGVI